MTLTKCTHDRTSPTYGPLLPCQAFPVPKSTSLLLIASQPPGSHVVPVRDPQQSQCRSPTPRRMTYSRLSVLVCWAERLFTMEHEQQTPCMHKYQPHGCDVELVEPHPTPRRYTPYRSLSSVSHIRFGILGKNCITHRDSSTVPRYPCSLGIVFLNIFLSYPSTSRAVEIRDRLSPPSPSLSPSPPSWTWWSFPLPCSFPDLALAYTPPSPFHAFTGLYFSFLLFCLLFECTIRIAFGVVGISIIPYRFLFFFFFSSSRNSYSPRIV
ncbi:hypothetical protein CC80DRAFT_118271 [Byssothecium circinans]|uniref:Uncharacterized protein n=1 Tax=Byssothecium circinans TaxID=147558 RepID=A0A6A5TT78_9PLEO|nr:hypothetical protein CC80DRAFT_118271 [Byssothecium circinans]